MTLQETKQILRYLVIGGSTYVLYAGLLFVLPEFTGMDSHIGFITSFVIANIYNYLAHYYITFTSKRRHLQTVKSFILVVMAGVIGGSLLTELTRLFWEESYTLWVAGAYGLVWPAVSYFLLKIKVFRQPENL